MNAATGLVVAAKCLVAMTAIGAIVYLTPAIENWLLAHARAAIDRVLLECDPPQPGEVLIVQVVSRGDRLVGVGCLRVASPGSYAK